MTDRKSDAAPPMPAATGREREVHARVESLFRRCESSKNPVLAYSRACSKVGYLARDGVRSELHHLESAFNERMHALMMGRYGHPEKAKEHNRHCAEELRFFQRAIRRELVHPRAPLSTPALQERIHRSLDVGQWSRARSDLDDLMRRPDVGRPLPALDTYSRSWNLHPEHFTLLQDRIDQCNANVRERSSVAQDHRHAPDATPQWTAAGVSRPPPSVDRASDAAVARSVQCRVPPAIDSRPYTARAAELEVGKGRGLDR